MLRLCVMLPVAEGVPVPVAVFVAVRDGVKEGEGVLVRLAVRDALAVLLAEGVRVTEAESVEV